MAKGVNHQFSLFGFQKPKAKVPFKKIIGKERVEEAKRLFDQGDKKQAANKVREIREALENWERRLINK